MLVKAVAGSGKSTISHSIAQLLQLEGLLASSFFFQRMVADANTTRMLFTTIARDMANHHPTIGAAISTALESDIALTRAPLSRQFDALFSKPLSRTSKKETGRIVVIIDGLDDIIDDETDTTLLEILSGTKAATLPPNIRILVTARPTRNVELFLSGKSHIRQLEIDIHSTENLMDIAAYVDLQLQGNVMPRLELGALDEEMVRKLKNLAEGLFIWIATVFAYLRTAYTPRAKLEALLRKSEGCADIDKKMDALYTAILNNCGVWDDTHFCDDYQLVMGSIMAAKRPLSQAAIQALYRDGDLHDPPKLLLERFGSVLTGLHDETKPVRILHLSFYDFITARAAETTETRKFYLSQKEHSQRLGELCLRTMIRDFTASPLPGTGYLLEGQVPNLLPSGISTPNQVIATSTPGIPKLTDVPEHLVYACERWRDHVLDVEHPTHAILEIIGDFLSRHNTNWIEVVSSEGVFRGSLGIWLWVKVSGDGVTPFCPELNTSC